VTVSERPPRLPAPLLTRAFIPVVVAAGVGVVAHSALVLVRSTLPPEWVVFAILTIASGMLTIKIPSIEARFSISEALAFASVLLYGPDVGAVILALDALRISVRWKMNAQQTAFNFANLGLSMWLSGTAFFAASGLSPLYHHGAAPANALWYLALMTLVYFAVNSGLMATVVGLMQRRPIHTVWRTHYLPLLPSIAAGASVAMLLVLAFREVQFTALALIVPVLVITYLTVHSTYGRLEDAQVHVADLNRLLFSTVETLATAIDAKDEVTHDHVRRVQQGAMALAREIGMTDATELKALEAAALLHDTGKIAIPEHILNKPGRLTPAEFEKMKRHAPIGAQILSSIEFPYPVVPIVRHHHENWDGTGYPDGVKGEAIPLGARILSVVDCFDALTSDRPYRRRMTNEQALQILHDRRGTMYDPAIVDRFVAVYDRIMPAPGSEPHPAAQAIGEERAHEREAATADTAAPASEVVVGEGVLALASLSRAIEGQAQLSDVGALLWMIVRQAMPTDAMAIFVPDEVRDHMMLRYAAGLHLTAFRNVTVRMGGGIVGWAAVNRRGAVNADPAIDLGVRAAEAVSPLKACLAVPLVENDTVMAVLALYAQTPGAYSDDHVRLLDLLAPRLTSALAGALLEDSRSFTASQTPSLRLVKSSAV
jgi:putative nucleotidyltransferase with HDIG domain